MRASVLGTGHCLPARARVKVGRSAHFRRQPGRQPACMHCMHKNRLNFSDLSSDHACRILAGWLAGWRTSLRTAIASAAVENVARHGLAILQFMLAQLFDAC